MYFESLEQVVVLAPFSRLSEAIILYWTTPWMISLSIKLKFSFKHPQLSVLASARQVKHGLLILCFHHRSTTLPLVLRLSFALLGCAPLGLFLLGTATNTMYAIIVRLSAPEKTPLGRNDTSDPLTRGSPFCGD